MRHIFIALVKLYRKFISPMFKPCCRFSPSCSAYCIKALEVHGSIIGLSLSIWRILRCNPFCKGGYDPVPPKKQHKRIVFPAKRQDLDKKE